LSDSETHRFAFRLMGFARAQPILRLLMLAAIVLAAVLNIAAGFLVLRRPQPEPAG
jgi:hypothetical protein